MNLKILRTALVIFSSCLSATASHGEQIVIKGSDTLGTLLIPEWVESFKRIDPDVRFNVSARGSTMGIDSLIHLGIDIAVSSRRAFPVEFSSAKARGIVLKPTIVCYDGVSVVVHKSNPVSELTLQDLEFIFSGAIDRWDDVNGLHQPIVLYARNPNSGTYSDFQTFAMNRRPYAMSCRKMISNEAILNEISNDPRGIGYVGLAFINNHPDIKVIPIDGVMPSVETVMDKTYPIWRPNFVYTDGRPRGVVAEFIKFMRSKHGQSIVEEVGFVPIQ